MTTTSVPRNLRRPKNHSPFRWHKEMGEPRSLCEWLVQNGWLLLPYNSLIVTIVLILLLRGQ